MQSAQPYPTNNLYSPDVLPTVKTLHSITREQTFEANKSYNKAKALRAALTALYSRHIPNEQAEPIRYSPDTTYLSYLEKRMQHFHN